MSIQYDMDHGWYTQCHSTGKNDFSSLNRLLIDNNLLARGGALWSLPLLHDGILSGLNLLKS